LKRVAVLDTSQNHRRISEWRNNHFEEGFSTDLKIFYEFSYKQAKTTSIFSMARQKKKIYKPTAHVQNVPY
jgi:hypothetical protein